MEVIIDQSGREVTLQPYIVNLQRGRLMRVLGVEFLKTESPYRTIDTRSPSDDGIEGEEDMEWSPSGYNPGSTYLKKDHDRENHHTSGAFPRHVDIMPDIISAFYEQANNISQSSRRPSVTEFSQNPERYSGFILVVVLSTGKMAVMTRQEARAKAAQIKIISDNSDSLNTDFFQSSSNSDNVLVFDPATGKIQARDRVVRNPYQRSENFWENLQRSSTEEVLMFDPTTGKLVVRAREK